MKTTTQSGDFSVELKRNRIRMRHFERMATVLINYRDYSNEPR